MAITINGTGSITGISAGGLPDGSITNDDLAGSITDAKLSGTTCKAWVNFDGTGTPAIRASYNVSSITDNGTGSYTVNFTTALADANYVCLANASSTTDTSNLSPTAGVDRTSSSVRIDVEDSSAQYDVTLIDVTVFR